MITVVIPSRGRPDRAHEAVEAAADLAALPSTEVVLAVDRDDPLIDRYTKLRWGRARVMLTVLEPAASGNLVRATNAVSVPLAADQPDSIIGNLGDDHMCRTPGWDVLVAEALEQPGIAYGDDLLQGERLPTAPFISARVVNALGWYALPSCHHMYIDDAWKALGNEAGILRFVPELVIEHVHPATGQVPSDAGYARADAEMSHDMAAYYEWRNTAFYKDVTNVRRALMA